MIGDDWRLFDVGLQGPITFSEGMWILRVTSLVKQGLFGIQAIESMVVGILGYIDRPNEQMKHHV